MKDTNFKLKTKPTGGPGNTRKPPKYFVEFRDQMFDFIKEQRKFNLMFLMFLKETILNNNMLIINN